MDNREDFHGRESVQEPIPSWLQKWWTALRPFALPASSMSVVFGSVLAVTIGGASFDLPLFLAALLGMMLLHTGGNLLNDVFDYKKGIDRHVNPVSGAVVRGWIGPRDALVAGCLFLLLGSVLGVYIVSRVGAPILWIGAAGVAIGVLYTWGPYPFKFNALGDLAVFLNFGILGALGAWTVQTGVPSWTPVIWAVPMSMLVVGILHANNWRDIASDTDGSIRTVANLLGETASHAYYTLLVLGPFVVILLLILLSWAFDLTPRMPLTFLVTLLAVPLAVKRLKMAANRHQSGHVQNFLALDGTTAQLNLLFGVLCTAALLLHAAALRWL